jgi:hypothetical protein
MTDHEQTGDAPTDGAAELRAAVQRLGEPLDLGRIQELMERLPGDIAVETYLACANEAIDFYKVCVEATILLAAQGDLAESRNYHQQSYACTQIAGQIMLRVQRLHPAMMSSETESGNGTRDA